MKTSYKKQSLYLKWPKDLEELLLLIYLSVKEDSMVYYSAEAWKTENWGFALIKILCLFSCDSNGEFYKIWCLKCWQFKYIYKKTDQMHFTTVILIGPPLLTLRLSKPGSGVNHLWSCQSSRWWSKPTAYRCLQTKQSQLTCSFSHRISSIGCNEISPRYSTFKITRYLAPNLLHYWNRVGHIRLRFETWYRFYEVHYFEWYTVCRK